MTLISFLITFIPSYYTTSAHVIFGIPHIPPSFIHALAERERYVEGLHLKAHSHNLTLTPSHHGLHTKAVIIHCLVCDWYVPLRSSSFTTFQYYISCSLGYV